MAEESAVSLRQQAMEVAESTPWGEHGANIQNYAQAKMWATDIAKSGLAPQGMNTPEQILLAVQTGSELGLTPVRALQSVVVVNGNVTLKADTITALIHGSGQLEQGTVLAMGCEHRDGVLTGFCRSTRRGGVEVETTFSQDDAKKAGLWGKVGPWSSYPKRMLQHRAVGFHGRDHWGDVCHGIMLTDEAIDSRPPARDVTPSPDKRPAPDQEDPLFGSPVTGDSAEPDPPEEIIDIDPETGEVIPPPKEPGEFALDPE